MFLLAFNCDVGDDEIAVMKKCELPIYVNGRFLSQKATGVQRFAIASLLSLHHIFGERLVVLVPGGHAKSNSAAELPCSVKEVWGGKGHFWEQITLPIFLHARGRGFLFCFCGLPPLLYHRSVYTIHDMAVFAFPNTFKKVYSSFYRLMLKLAVWRVRALTVVSEFTREEVLKYLGVKVPFITSNVITKPNFDGHNSRVLSKYGLDSCRFGLCVGTLEPRKNLNTLEGAVSSMDWPNLTLAVVGGSGGVFASGDVKDQAIPHLKYLGYVDDTDLAVLYSNAEIFIYPSLYEGFGIPPLEAMASGCLVAVARGSSLPEVCGGAAEYFDPKNQSDLILAVRRLLSFDETKRLRRQEQGEAQAQIYTPSRQQLQWLKVCRSIGIKVDKTDY